jgi:hypothetical protein
LADFCRLALDGLAGLWHGSTIGAVNGFEASQGRQRASGDTCQFLPKLLLSALRGIPLMGF